MSTSNEIIERVLIVFITGSPVFQVSHWLECSLSPLPVEMHIVNIFHRELFEIPIWELNGKFPHYWEIFGTRNSFFGILLGSCWPLGSGKRVFLGEQVFMFLVSQPWENVVTATTVYSQISEQYGNFSPSNPQSCDQHGNIFHVISKVVNNMGTFPHIIPKFVHIMGILPK